MAAAKSGGRFRTTAIATTAIFALLALTVIGSSNPTLSDIEMKAAAKFQADECVQAMIRGDDDSFAAKIYPKVLEMIGGKRGLAQLRKGTQQDEKSDGIVFNSVTIGDVVDLKQSGAEAYAIVPEALEMSVPQGVLKSDSYLLGISEDGGRTWKFIDGAGIPSLGDNIHAILPHLPTDIKLPTRKEPVLFAAPAKASVPATRDSVPSPMMEIERADYKFKVPTGCTVDPEDPAIDLDHYTAVNLPDSDTLLILVLDDKAAADRRYNELVNKYKGKVKGPVETKSELFNGRGGKAAIVTGKINGMRFSIETGYFSGRQKAFIVVCTYEESHPARTQQILKEAVDSFFIKE